MSKFVCYVHLWYQALSTCLNMSKRSMHTDLDSVSPVVSVVVENNLENLKFTEITCMICTRILNFMFLLFSQEPEPVLLGTEKQWTMSGKKRKHAEVREKMMYIPLLEIIQSLFYSPDVVRMVCS